MKKIKNSDFIIDLPVEVAGKELSTGDYVTMRLYTVNAENYTEFRYEGGICPEQQKVDAYRMANMESGVVQMIVESHIVDISMPDGYFDLALQQTTDYYWIKTASESSQEQINELRERLAEEEQVREAADDALEEEISGLTESIEELQSDLDSNYYLADEVDELLEGKLDASAYTPVDIDNYYTKAEVDDAISASVEDNKVLYVQFTEVSEGSTALTCSHTFEQIYEAYSNGRVVVGQFKMIDLRLLACKEDAYMFNGMYSNRTCYVVGSKNSMQEEHIGYNFIDLQVQMDDVPTQDSQKTVKSAGVYDALQDKLDVSAYTPVDIDNYYTKAEVDDAISASVEDNKVLYVQFEEVQQGETALTCSHTFAQIYESYSKGRVVVGQWRNVDFRIIACKENGYLFFGMYNNRACYIAGRRNIYVTPHEEFIGYQYVDFTIEMDDVPTQNSQKAVKSAGVYDEMSDKVDKTTFNAFSASTENELNRLDQVKLDASEYTPYDDTQVLADIAALQTNKLDASAYTQYDDTELRTAISGKVDTSVFENTEQATSALLNDLNERKLDASAYTPVDLTDYYTKTEVDSAISGCAEVVQLTQAEYNAIVTPDPNTIYIISDANAVNMGNYYTKTEIDNMIGTINTALNNINGNS